MTNCAFYPVSSSTVPIIRFIINNSSIYRITTLLSFPGSGLDGRDGGYADNGTSIGITVKTNIHNAMDNWDCLLLADCPEESGTLNYDDMALHIVLAALEAKKSVICSRRLQEDDVYFCKRFASLKGASFQYLSEVELKQPKKAGPISKINVFSALFGGVIRESNALDAFLSSYGELSHTHKVAAFSTDINVPLCGVNSLNSYLQGYYDEQDKVYSINSYIKRTIEKERPDIILLHIAEPMVAYSDLIPNGFGIVPFLLSKVLTVDSFICSIPFSLCSSDFIHNFSEGILSQNGYPIDYIVVSNVFVDIPASIERKKISVTHIPYLEISTGSLTSNIGDIPIYDLHDKSELLAFYNSLKIDSETFYQGVRTIEWD